MRKVVPAPLLAVLLTLPAGAILQASTTLTFAVSGATGVDGTSGGVILANNPNASKMLASGVSPFTANPGYGSNVTGSSANNGAYLVTGDATPDIALAWSSSGSPPGTNIIEGICKGVAGWGSDPSNISNNGVGQINNLVALSSFSVTFTPAAGKGVLIESLDFYKSALNLSPNQGRGYRVTVTGTTTNYSGSFAISTAVEAIGTFSLGSGVIGKPGEAITLTVTRPSAADELAIVQAGLGSGFTVYNGTNNHNQNGIDNLRFSQVSEAAYALDTDGDGLSDIEETYNYHTSATLADTDGDGIPDGVEVNTTLTNPTVSDAKLVSYLLAANSGGKSLLFRDSYAGTVKLRLSLADSPDLLNWSDVPLNGAGVTSGNASTTLRIDLPNPGTSKRFYRLEPLAP